MRIKDGCEYLLGKKWYTTAQKGRHSQWGLVDLDERRQFVVESDGTILEYVSYSEYPVTTGMTINDLQPLA